MDEKRQIECDCGTVLEEKKILLEESIESEALVCPNCGYSTLTREQALKYFNLKQMKEDLEAERKIIQIGNSIGMTFPDKLKEHGFIKGNKVKLEPIDEKSFKVTIA